VEDKYDSPPFFEILAETVDFSDANLWRSNSFAAMRPRLIVEVKRAIVALEYEISHEEYLAQYGSKQHAQRARSQRGQDAQRARGEA
jgi:hypothetical protein